MLLRARPLRHRQRARVSTRFSVPRSATQPASTQQPAMPRGMHQERAMLTLTPTPTPSPLSAPQHASSGPRFLLPPASCPMPLWATCPLLLGSSASTRLTLLNPRAAPPPAARPRGRVARKKKRGLATAAGWSTCLSVPLVSGLITDHRSDVLAVRRAPLAPCAVRRCQAAFTCSGSGAPVPRPFSWRRWRRPCPLPPSPLPPSSRPVRGRAFGNSISVSRRSAARGEMKDDMAQRAN